MTVHFIGRADIGVALPPHAAMRLFTPEGERSWAGKDGWNPWYPDPTRTAGAGAVFTTRHKGGTTIWVMVDHGPDWVRYARVTPDALAGTIEVRALCATGAGTDLRVTYDLTALTPHAITELARFAAQYDAEIATRAQDIAESLTQSGRARRRLMDEADHEADGGVS
jgi:hypothetical protein